MEVSNFKMKGNTITVKDATARSSIATINNNIGDISALPTTDKSNIVNSITELNGTIASIKAPSYESNTESIVFE